MKRLRAKLNSQRGETLVELMASILIATLSVGLLLGAVAVSVNLNRQAEAADETFYTALTAAESRAGAVTSGNISVAEPGKGSITIPVNVYGGDGLWSYAMEATGGDGT